MSIDSIEKWVGRQKNNNIKISKKHLVLHDNEELVTYYDDNDDCYYSYCKGQFIECQLIKLSSTSSTIMMIHVSIQVNIINMIT